MTEKPTESKHLICAFEDCRIGIPISLVVRVVPAVEVTTVESELPSVIGVIDYRGTIIPVFSARQRLGYEQSPVRAEDMFVLVQLSDRISAVCVDTVEHIDVIDEVPARLTASGESELIGIARGEDGLIVIIDMERFLTEEEVQNLNHTIENMSS